MTDIQWDLCRYASGEINLFDAYQYQFDILPSKEQSAFFIQISLIWPIKSRQIASLALAIAKEGIK